MMQFSILGCGIWGRGLQGFSALRSGLADPAFVPRDDDYARPKPEAISARERRRSGELINLAVQVAHEACANAGIDPQLPPSVFVSSMSDTAITDYMCRKLVTSEKTLSPTKFHNSVHNAPSGYWSISAENRAPSSFVGGFDYSVGAGLLEAVSQSHAARTPVLFVAYDIANTPPFHDIQRIDESLGVALLLNADTDEGDAGDPAMQPLARGALRYETGLADTRDALAIDRGNIVHPGLSDFAEQTSLPGALALALWCASRGSVGADRPIQLAASAFGQLIIDPKPDR
ncbi:MAG: beta-ketoacyl synthase chain length factor [Pseudomonadaceae bacterium]|nr:beta-ketoacyl synthase chain length factor [Pseudomonadaceae bacterium]